jgi:hypothetical protein
MNSSHEHILKLSIHSIRKKITMFSSNYPIESNVKHIQTVKKLFNNYFKPKFNENFNIFEN